jgi:hypothetical protein
MKTSLSAMKIIGDRAGYYNHNVADKVHRRGRLHQPFRTTAEVADQARFFIVVPQQAYSTLNSAYFTLLL